MRISICICIFHEPLMMYIYIFGAYHDVYVFFGISQDVYGFFTSLS